MRAPVDRVREIEVRIISAQDLTNVKHITKMRPYAVAYVEQDFHVAKTGVDGEGGVNPRWNEVVKVRFHEKLLEDSTAAMLNVDVYAHGLMREKLVGSARVLLSDVLMKDGCGDETKQIQVLKKGKPQGLLSLSFSMKDEEEKKMSRPVSARDEDEGPSAAVEVTPEMVEEKLGNEMVLLGSRAHSSLNLGVLGDTFDRSSSI